jgi:hypothetical protein
LLVAGQLLMENWAATAVTFPDADDAMRLVQLRDFLAGQGWFDLHQARLNPPLGYDSHWSRLIDAALAGLFTLFNLFADHPFAERLMTAVWPVLWLLPTIGAVAAIAWRLGGREAAVIVLLLAIFAIPGFQQFRPGRIDHHNVHITLALTATAAAVWSDRLRWCAWLAGGLSGLAIAIGFEAVAFYVLIGAGFAVRYIVDGARAAELRAYAVALAASTAASFLVTVGPGRWTTSVCDMIAINSAAAVMVASVGLIVGARFFTDTTWPMRFAAVAGAAVTALVVFVAFEPRCLEGPFGLVDSAIRPIWLDNVSEAQPLTRIMREAPLTAIAMASFPAAALLALFVTVRKSRRRDPGFLLAGATLLLAAVMTIAAIRIYSYAVWLGLPFVAVAITDVFAGLQIKSVVPKFLVALLITPAAVTMAALAVAQPATNDRPLDLNSPERQACVRQDSYAVLAALPAGLVAVDALEWGPYVLAWTRQAVLAAPYHRIPAGIVASHQIFASAPDQAHRAINQNYVTYVVTCGSHAPEGIGAPQLAASLWTKLREGAVPGWLERVPQSRDAALEVYRVKG